MIEIFEKCKQGIVGREKEEEREIVLMRTGCDDARIVSLAVRMVRATREHDDIKMGASVRAAIDLVDFTRACGSSPTDPGKPF